ncbi:hypothetical protein [Limnovirga soli]|jgi:hypothetical protein|uniref:Uncharacterized protein n=1 Tax=Limnovirga soli TaxID=2656915 RepID=A0A8J8JQN6_9BACT|nr:hypothetical protein [Limnovirga soli]NNV54932.1 hypothetical protein [Limnovirga soli]
MADNTEEEHLDNPTNTQSENSPDEVTPTSDTESFNQNQETKSMEVHHHAHQSHGKKSLKHYFWEFFMLFLAVFCGSLAELQVEHYVEHQRETKYAQTLVEDLVNDTIDLKYDIEGWSKVDRRADTIIMEMEKDVDLRDHRLLYKCVSQINTNNTFLYHDRTIQQLKSAGNFRLLRDNAIADSLVEYDGWIVKTVTNIEDIYGKVLNPEMQNLENQLFNSKYFSIARNKAKLDSAFLLSPEKIMMQKGKEEIAFQFYNKVHNYKSLTQARIYYLGTTLRRATNLIALLKHHYDIE